MSDFSASHRDIYLRLGGAQGHVMDLTDKGGHEHPQWYLNLCAASEVDV